MFYRGLGALDRAVSRFQEGMGAWQSTPAANPGWAGGATLQLRRSAESSESVFMTGDTPAGRKSLAGTDQTVSSSLYGFIPIYNVYSFTCTSVSGIAVKYK